MENADVAEILERLWSTMDAADLEDSVAERRRRIEDVIEELDGLTAQWSSADVLYSLGYAWYVHPDHMSSSLVQQKVEQTLRAALDADPSHARAKMYLGHNAYDMGHYHLAQERFDHISAGDLPDYLQFKVDEMRVCCSIHLMGLAPSLDALEEFAQIVERHSIEDICPQNLAKALKGAAWDLDPENLVRMAGLARRLDQAGQFENWFVELVASGSRVPPS